MEENFESSAERSANNAEDRSISNEFIDCRLSDTPHCRLLNMGSCNECFVRKLSEKDQRLVMEDIKTIAAAMPYGGPEKLMHGDECVLCAAKPNAADAGFARFDIGHLHPTASDERKKGSRTYKRDTGIVVPIQLPVCKKCKRRIQLINFLPLSIGIIISFASFIIVSLNPVFTALTKLGRPIPLLVSLIGILLGVIAANIIRIRLTNSASNKTCLNPERIKSISEFINEGWFVIPNSELDMPYTFSKKGLKQGILTGADQEKTIEEIINWKD